jgi:hypothetical protein
MIKRLTIFAQIFISSELAQGSEVIVCTPVELSYKAAGGVLTVYSKNEVTSSNFGVLCNSSRSWCKNITVRPGQAIEIYIDKANISKEMIFYQTEYASKANYGGCSWRVNM